MYDSKMMHELGYAFLNAGEVNFKEGVYKYRSEYQNIAGVVNLALSCELFLKCLLNAAGLEFKKNHTLESLWKQYMKSCPENAGVIKATVMSRLSTDMSFEDLIKDDSNVFNNYRYLYEPDKLTAISNNPVRPQFLRVLCITLCGYAKSELTR